jgi:hypothetical protein
MNKFDKAVMRSLLAKLSAVRITLEDEEQALLDQLILGSQAEVSLHNMKPAATPGPEEALTRRAHPAVTPGPDEVQAHSMKPAAAPGPEEVLKSRLTPGLYKEWSPDEVNAHSMSQGAATPGPDEVLKDRVTPGVFKEFSPDEVNAHSMEASPDEVIKEGSEAIEAEALPLGVHRGARFLATSWVNVYYDPELEAYKLDP